MDISDVTHPAASMLSVQDALRPDLSANTVKDKHDADLQQAAKDFESILIHQLLSSMKDTIPKSDLADSSSEQIQGMFWSFMSEAVSNEGGLGLWKQIYQQMAPDGAAAVTHSHSLLDKRV